MIPTNNEQIRFQDLSASGNRTVDSLFHPGNASYPDPGANRGRFLRKAIRQGIALLAAAVLFSGALLTGLQTAAEALPDLSEYIYLDPEAAASANNAAAPALPPETPAQEEPLPPAEAQQETATQEAAEQNTIRIDSIGAFFQFAEQCKDANWSFEKTVSLDADIDLTGTEFQPIPYFCGTFLGNRHSITGLSVTENAERAGLFAVITKDGCVSELRVTGTVAPTGAREPIAGGLAGENSGSIVNCIFEGSVLSDYSAGGIAGINFSTAKITDSKVSGTVSGSLCSGGITADNKGVVSSCENYAKVTNKDAGLLGYLDSSLLKGPVCGTSTGTVDDCRDYSGRISSGNGNFFPLELSRELLLLVICVVLSLNFLGAITSLIIYSVRYDD